MVYGTRQLSLGVRGTVVKSYSLALSEWQDVYLVAEGTNFRRGSAARESPDSLLYLGHLLADSASIY